MEWKLLALDLDGTTLNSSEEISDTNLSAIRRASEAGVKVIITTGRSYTSAYKYIRAIDSGEPSVTYNGALICNGEKALRTLTLPKTKIHHTLDTLRDLGQPPIVYTIEEKRYIDDPESLHANFFEFSKGSTIENIEVDDLMKQHWEKVVRISVFTDGDTTQMLDKEFLKKFGSSLKTEQTYFPEWNFWIFEILNSECSKPKALQFLCNRLRINRGEVIAVGDNRNDIEMLDWSGLGVAMRNSLPDVAEHADYVTTRSNDEHGVAEVIDRFILEA
jgi:Cof subfamily protein (haloacid dehalogenase superfamily)